MDSVQLSKSDTELFQTMAILFRADKLEEYYHLPFYFKVIGNDVYELFSYDELPEYVKEMAYISPKENI